MTESEGVFHFDYVGAWLEIMARGLQHAREARWEMALQAYSAALNLYNASSEVQEDPSRKHRLLKDLAFVNRCMGRYQQALALLDELLAQPSLTDSLRLNATGDLGVLYRQLGRLEAARDAFQDQYALALQLSELQRTCRAVGNLGMVNYQISQRDDNRELLESAARQLQERIELAQKLNDAYAADPEKAGKSDYPTILQAIGLSRLSLCYSARGEHEQAIATALEAVQLETQEKPFSDSSVEAISRFFYGRALYRAGRHQEALEQFDLPKKCSPAVAFAKEPSSEHCEYLQELLNAGAEMDTPDEHHYHALDYAVFNGNKASELIILKSLEQKLVKQHPVGDVSAQLGERLREAKLRKHYRETFHDRMRPILLSREEGNLHLIRRAYASAIESSPDFGNAFDRFKFVRYTDFANFGRFPRCTDGLTQHFDPLAGGASLIHIVFISYRWLTRDLWRSHPDNAEHQQYRRTLRAINEYLKLHPDINVEDFGIWIDFACIDQESPLPGISALPLIIAQCNALISLVDEEYHERAWCSVEVMMIKALREEYGLHLWYEHDEKEGLRVGPKDLLASPKGKKLGIESDRERVAFLERQCRLLCPKMIEEIIS